MTEPIMAYRAWNITKDGKLKPIGMYNASEWKPMVEQKAVCHKFTMSAETHTAPKGDCSCGLYAYKSVAQLDQVGVFQRRVLGRVAIWGRIVEFENGYHAEYAYPQALYYGGEYPYASRWAVERAARTYGIEASIAPDELLDIMWDKAGSYNLDVMQATVRDLVHHQLQRYPPDTISNALEYLKQAFADAQKAKQPLSSPWVIDRRFPF